MSAKICVFIIFWFILEKLHKSIFVNLEMSSKWPFATAIQLQFKHLPAFLETQSALYLYFLPVCVLTFYYWKHCLSCVCHRRTLFTVNYGGHCALATADSKTFRAFSVKVRKQICSFTQKRLFLVENLLKNLGWVCEFVFVSNLDLLKLPRGF